MTTVTLTDPKTANRIVKMADMAFHVATTPVDAENAFRGLRRTSTQINIGSGRDFIRVAAHAYGLDQPWHAALQENAQLRREKMAAQQQANTAINKRITLEAQIAELTGQVQKLVAADKSLRAENARLSRHNKELLVENARKMTAERRTALSPVLLLSVAEALEKERAVFVASRNTSRAAAKNSTATVREAVKALRIGRAKGTLTTEEKNDITRLMQANMEQRRHERRQARMMDSRARRRMQAMKPLLQALQTQLEKKNPKPQPQPISVPRQAMSQPQRPGKTYTAADYARAFTPDVLAGLKAGPTIH